MVRRKLAAIDAEPKPWRWLPKPKLVCVDGRVVARAVVIVSPADKNWFLGPKACRTDGVVHVKP